MSIEKRLTTKDTKEHKGESGDPEIAVIGDRETTYRRFMQMSADKEIGKP
jgi:hypothetical protein